MLHRQWYQIWFKTSVNRCISKIPDCFCLMHIKAIFFILLVEWSYGNAHILKVEMENFYLLYCHLFSYESFALYAQYIFREMKWQTRTRICSKITAPSKPNGTLLNFIPFSLCCLERQGISVANVNIAVLSSGKYIQELWEETSSSTPALRQQMPWRHWAARWLKNFERVCLCKMNQ